MSSSTYAAAPRRGLDDQRGTALFYFSPDAALRQQFTVRNVTETVVSNVPTLSEHATNTDTKRAAKNAGQLHAEGGWPRDVDYRDAEQRARLRRRVEREESYLNAVAQLCRALAGPVRVAAAVDIHGDHWPEGDEADDAVADEVAVVGSSAAPAAASSASPAGSSDALGAGSGAGSTRRPPTAVLATRATIPDPIAPLATEESVGRKGVMRGTRRSSPLRRRSLAGPLPPTAGPRQSPGAEPQRRGTIGSRRPVELLDTAAMDVAGSSPAEVGEFRPVTSVAWHSADAARHSHLAVGYGAAPHPAGHAGPLADPTWRGASVAQLREAPAVGCIFDVARPGRPELVLRALAPVSALAFNPRESHTLVAGTAAGTVALFDTRRGSAPTASSSATARSGSGSTLPVAGQIHTVTWLQSTGRAHEVAAADGGATVVLWDTRELTKPLDIVTLQLPTPLSAAAARRPSAAAAAGGAAAAGLGVRPVGAVSVDYLPSAASAGRLLVGTASGLVLTALCRGRAPTERVVNVQGAMTGPVTCVARHPACGGIFAAAGGATAAVWCERRRLPLLVLRRAGPRHSPLGHPRTVSAGAECVACAWLGACATVLLTLFADGRLDAWAIALSAASPTAESCTTDPLIAASPPDATLLATQNPLLAAAACGGAGTSDLMDDAAPAVPVHHRRAVRLAISADHARAAIGTSDGGVVLVELEHVAEAARALKAAQAPDDAAWAETDERQVVLEWSREAMARDDWARDVVRAADAADGAALADHDGAGTSDDDSGAGSHGGTPWMGPAVDPVALPIDRLGTQRERAAVLMQAAAAGLGTEGAGAAGLSAEEAGFDDIGDPLADAERTQAQARTGALESFADTSEPSRPLTRDASAGGVGTATTAYAVAVDDDECADGGDASTLLRAVLDGALDV